MRMAPLVLAAFAVAALAHPAAARVWSQKWDVASRPLVQIETTDAHVYVHQGPAGHVDARVEYEVHVWGWHSDVREPRVTLERNGDTLKVVARPRSTIVVFGGVTEQFRIDVTLPEESDVEVRTRDGAVDVEPVQGRLDVQTTDGRINVHGARGDVRLWTTDGGIDADALDGTLRARTVDGHLIVNGRFDAMDIRSADGRVEATIARGSALAGAWEFATSDGGITLRIPRNLRALMDVSTRDGHVHVDLPLATQDGWTRRTMRGQLNGGTVPLRVRTADGSITLALSE